MSKWRDTVLMENIFIQELLGNRHKKTGLSLEEHNKELIADNRSYRSRGVRTKRYKYFVYDEVNPFVEELYDLENDPYEQNNLVFSPKYTEVLKQLREKTTELHSGEEILAKGKRPRCFSQTTEAP